MSAAFKSTLYHQVYMAPLIDLANNMNSGSSSGDFFFFANFDLIIQIQKGIVSGKRSKLYGTLGAGLETMLFREREYHIHSTIDTLLSKEDYGQTEIHFSPTLNAGLGYRVENKMQDFWNIGIDFTYAFAKNLGTAAYTYGDPDPVETGNFVFRGSKISFKVGYLFQFNKSKTNQNE